VKGGGPKKYEWVCNCPICRGLIYPIIKKFKVKDQMSEGREDELKEILEALKDTLAELKTTLGDISGPFSSIKKEIPVGADKASIGQKESKEASSSYKEAEQDAVKVEKTTKIYAQQSETQVKEKLSLSKVLKALKTLHLLRESMPGELIEDEIAVLKTLGWTEEKQLELLRQLNALVDKSVKNGLTLEDQVVSLYIISKLLGISDEEIEQEFLDSVLEKMRKKEGKA
jgi:dimeric dUTPase (all-alpha-NTP-PPase superfamily)